MRLSREEVNKIKAWMEQHEYDESSEDIHFKPYTKEEFVEIAVNVLDREEGVDRDIALIIADGVYNRLKSSNIRECVRIARLARNDFAQVNLIVDTFAKYGGLNF